jgi:hypothetical protein
MPSGFNNPEHLCHGRQESSTEFSDLLILHNFSMAPRPSNCGDSTEINAEVLVCLQVS